MNKNVTTSSKAEVVDVPDASVKHPAKFSVAVLDAIREIADGLLPDGARVLDPFAGVGGIHSLAEPMGWETWGVELEPEWAAQHPRTVCGDSTRLGTIVEEGLIPSVFDAIVTSPAYGNRMADAYAGDAKGSKRITYRIALGRPLDPRNGASMQWGAAYMALHREVWREAADVVRPGAGYLILNVSDHVRGGSVMPVSAWHVGTLAKWGFHEVSRIDVPTPRMRFGANGGARVDHEHVILFQRGA